MKPGEVVAEGKTKIITAGEGPHTVVFQMLDQLTGGDAARQEAIPGMGEMYATQIANCMGLLNRRGVETAFIEQQGPTELLCWGCDMVPLECVMRRIAWGSALEREPQLRPAEGETPTRFDELRLEFYLKDTVVTIDGPPRMMPESQARELYLRDGTWAEGVFRDPYIKLDGRRWLLFDPHSPLAGQKPLMEIEPVLPGHVVHEVYGRMKRVFWTFEDAWLEVGYRGESVILVDFKIEFGRRWKDGSIVVADEINNGAWRIWIAGDPKRQLDKQLFRERAPMEEVVRAYQIVVTELTAKLLEVAA